MPNRLTRITTKGGDRGQSGLADGSRHPKSAPHFEALGDIDELNCAVGIVVSAMTDEHPLRITLLELQSRLFDLGGAIAMPAVEFSMEDQIAVLDRQIAEFNARLGPLANFILPGGTIEAAQMHLARAVCRRAERSTWKLLSEHADDYDQSLGVFLNRLSDALFVFARILNAGTPELQWQQRKPPDA